MIIHVVNTYRTQNEREFGRLQRAKRTWSDTAGKHNEYRLVARETYDRDSSIIGEERRLPFVKDVIHSAWSVAESLEDVVLLTNADTNLCSDAVSRILSSDCMAAWSERREVLKPQRSWLSSAEALMRGTEHCGVDLVGMKVGWWMEHWEDYPDMIMGCQAWDWVFRFMIGDAGKMIPAVCYHETHLPVWHMDRQSAGNLYNRRLAKEWVARQPQPLLGDIKRFWVDLVNY